MRVNMLNKVPPGVCPDCAVARTMLHLLFREIATNENLDVVATDKDGKVTAFNRMYVACETCDDSGRVPSTEGLEAATDDMPPSFPSKLSPARLGQTKEGEAKPVKQEQKGQPKSPDAPRT